MNVLSNRTWISAAVACALVCALLCGTRGPADCMAAQGNDDTQSVISTAIERVSGSLVRVDVLAAADVSQESVELGPTTGLIIEESGYIVTSSLRFGGKAANVIVTLPNGERLPAEVVGRIPSRMLVLLKVSAAGPLLVPLAVPSEEMAVGQSVLALGKTYGPEPSCSLGILSAVNRVWGKAIQTDANVSPANYGGPLVDIEGRVLGVLVPMGTSPNSVAASVELYDSGIGFAIPLADIFKVLPRWKETGDLRSGILGIDLGAGNDNDSPAKVTACRRNSPAFAAGIRAGDVITELNGRAIGRRAQVRLVLGPLYAGDTIHVVLDRQGERLELDVTLAEKLAPYAHPFLGVIPDAAAQGVTLAEVMQGGPAQAAGLQPGDTMTALDGKPVNDAGSLETLLQDFQPGDALQVTFSRGGAEQTVPLSLGAIPEEYPQAFPAADTANAAGLLPLITEEFVLPDFPGQATLVGPLDAAPAGGFRLAICLPASGSQNAAALEPILRAGCRERGLLVLILRPSEGAATRTVDPEHAARVLQLVLQKYPLRRAGLSVIGVGRSMSASETLASQIGGQVRAIAGLYPSRLPNLTENEPGRRIAIWALTTPVSGPVDVLATQAEDLRASKFPVTIVPEQRSPGRISAEQFRELARWLSAQESL